MLIRRSKLAADLRALPIDGFDMFLLTRVEGAGAALTIHELVALTPRAPLDTMQRVEQLVRLGILEVEGELAAELTVDGVRPLPGSEEAITLRPPPKRAAFDDAQTLRPPRPGAARGVIHARQAVSVEILSPSGAASRGSAPDAGNRSRSR